MKLLPLALSLFSQTARSGVNSLAGKARKMALVGITATVAAIYLLIALTIFLASHIGAVEACLAMGSVFAVASLVFYLQHRRETTRRKLDRVERTAIAASADTTAGAGAAVLVQAFLKGFTDGGR